MVRVLLGGIALVAFVLSVMGLFGRSFWMLDLCNHFRFQYALVLLAATFGLAFLRSWWMGALSFVGLLLNLALVLPLYRALPIEVAPGQPALSLMHFNVNTANTNHAGVVDEVKQAKPDLLFVQEVNDVWLDALESGLAEYRLVAAEPRTDNFGIACFVRQPIAQGPGITISSSRVYDITDGLAQVPVVELALVVDHRPMRILSIHPLPPISTAYANARDAVLQKAGQWSARQDVPCVVLGDLNATPWSTSFRDLQAAGDLVNSQAGYGRSATWPAGLMSLGMIPIDHVLHSRSLVTLDRRVGKASGSDHRPVVVALSWSK